MFIKDEQAGDINQISHIQYSAFKGHPILGGAEPVEHILVERLREADGLTFSLLAEENGCQIGHIAISPAKVGDSDSGWFLLGPIGVLPEHQGKGVGSQLIHESLSRLRNQGADGIVLVGEKKFYERFGFDTHPGLQYEGVPSMFVLGLSLSGAPVRGKITAHEAFTGKP